jgi:hypothetical protein
MKSTIVTWIEVNIYLKYPSIAKRILSSVARHQKNIRLN